MLRFVTFLLVLGLSTAACATDVPKLGQDALLQKMAAVESAPLLLDVRTAKEFADGHVPGAINISHDELETRIAELGEDRDRELVVYCRSGRRTEVALDLLARAGFTRLQHLEGDWLGWTAADLPVAKPD